MQVKKQSKKKYEKELTKKLNHVEQNLKSDNKESYTTHLQCKEEWESLIRKRIMESFLDLRQDGWKMAK